MKKVLLLASVFLILLLTSNFALSYTIDDPVGDKIGDWKFEIYGIDVLDTPTDITFSLFTNYPQSGYTVGTWHTFPGDLAIDANLDGLYEYGFALTTHNGILAGDLYNVSNWYTSNYYALSGYSYNKNQIVTIKNGTIAGSGTFLWNQIDTLGPPNSPDYRIDITFNPSLLHGLGTQMGIHWAAATCANDYVNGTAPVTPVPEPATMLLLGSGLFGVGAVLRKRLSKPRN